jgi:hypothetical protein
MGNDEGILDLPIVKPDIEVDVETKRKLKEQNAPESQIVVHCKYPAASSAFALRVWPSTFLFSKDGAVKCKLIHAENITIVPAWTCVRSGESYNFTLYFSVLPKSCKVFYLKEVIPERGGFQVLNIKRNKADVYTVIF